MMLKRQRGFTLIELMITVAIIAILAAIAFPSYQDSLRKSRRTDGKNALTQAMAIMERYYTERNTYATAAMCATAANKPDICPGNCSGVGGTCTSTEGNYTITFTTTPAGIVTPTAAVFALLATPGGSQAVDGKLYIDSTNLKQQDINNNLTFDAGEQYWK